MANSYQKALRRRKAIYIGLVAVLLVLSICVRGLVAMPTPELQRNVGKWNIQQQSYKLDLNEMSQGDVELTSSAVRLLLTGSRGLAVCALWMSAQDKQMRQEWNKLELDVNSVIMLQPHFVTPWLFQSWNLAYNVSVEMDQLNDMYFYIARGINLLAEGETINRNNPEMRYTIAFYYQNKFEVSDKVTTLRCLFQLSCLPKEERNYLSLMTGGQIDMKKFRAFCEKNPQFVRRLRETPIPQGKNAEGKEIPPQILVRYPSEVLRFLKDNESLPNRFRDDAPNVLEDRLKQFPVLPPPFYHDAGEELNPERAIAEGQASAVRAARDWFRYADEVIPPHEPIPGPTDYRYRDPERKRRWPKQPTQIIFRQGPPRAQTFIADQLAKEGWFDSDPWIVDRDRDSNDRWFEENVEIKPTDTSKEEWMVAHNMWLRHGLENGLYFQQNELKAFDDRARLYREKRAAGEPELRALRPDEQADKDLVDSYKAAAALHYYRLNLSMTNFEFFLAQSEMEERVDTVNARKLLFEADRARRRADYPEAIKHYEEAFGSQEKRGPWYKIFYDLIKTAESRQSKEKLIERFAEETCERQINYLRCLLEFDQRRYQRASLMLLDLMRLSSPAAGATPLYLASGDLFLQERVGAFKSVPPIWPPGPFDGFVPDLPPEDGQIPWISKAILDRVRMNMNISRPAAQAKIDPGATAPPQ